MQLFSHIRITTRFVYMNLCFLACMHISFALGFGSMGQVSSSIGGAGVALKNSAWGIYYNPALLGADRRTKIGYSFGAQIQEQNLLEIATNIDGITKISSTLGDKLLGGAVAGGAVTINGQSVGGVFGDTLQNLFGSTNIDQSAINKVAQDIGVTCNASCNNLGDLATAIQSSQNGAAEKLKDKLVGAAQAAGAPPLLTGILGSIDPSGLDELLTSIKDGKVDFQDILSKVGGIKIPKGADSDIDKLISAFETMQKAIESNEVSLISQNGLVLQIGGRQPTRKIEADGIGEVTVQESDNGRGAVAIGILPQAFANISAQIDPSHRRLIVGIGNGCDAKTGAGCTFIEATPGGDGLTLDVVNGGTSGNGQSEYLSSSILTGKHTPYGVVLGLVEIPIAYGHTFYTRAGDINIGIAPKFILASAYSYSTPISFVDINSSKPKFNTNTMQTTQTFGIDLGVLYTPAFLPNLNIGLVAKNLNAPRVAVSGSNAYVRLTQQVRAGVSYEMLNFLTLALDVDVLPNDTLSIANPKSQMVGGGILADFTFIDFRIGAMRDLYSKSGEGTILTTGVNLFGFLDVSVQYGLGKNVTLYGFNVSNYMALRVGGQFSF